MPSSRFDGLDVHDALRAAQAAAAARGRGWTALHAAAEFGHAEATRLLLAHGMPANARDADLVTPLHAAAHTGSAAVARILLAAGADIHALDRRGRTAAQLAAAAGHALFAALTGGVERRGRWWSCWASLWRWRR